MSFGVKNGPPTYQKTITKISRKYLVSFMNIFLDEFTYNDMENHLQKLKFCFQRCIEYGITLNPNKCTFMVYLGMILGFIVYKERRLLDPKKIQAIANMPPLKNLQQIQIFNGMA
jgi:hypothetical protein